MVLVGVGFEVEGVSKCQNEDYPVLTYRPSWEEFQDFQGCIRRVEAEGAHKTGLCKIIPPKEWVPQMDYEQFADTFIPTPVKQVVNGMQGTYTQCNFLDRRRTVAEFKQMAMSPQYETPMHVGTNEQERFDDLERKYWRNVTLHQPFYGADIEGTVTDPGQPIWNFQKLPSILDIVSCKQNVRILGVTTPYLYYGMWKATFPWHTEDMDLYSINYIHYGAPKTWYVVPPEHGKRFESVARSWFVSDSGACENFMRHKMSIMSPQFLKSENIPFSKTVQRGGEIMITFPFAYHQGFNHGFNCAESTNFATERWIEFGKWASHCNCREDAVKIDMDVFVQLYQPERYFNWRKGKDVNKIDYRKVHYPKPQSRIHLTISSHGNMATTSKQEDVGSVRKRKLGAVSDILQTGKKQRLNQSNNSFVSSSDVVLLLDDNEDRQSDSTEIASESEENAASEQTSKALDSSTQLSKCQTQELFRLFWRDIKRKVRGKRWPQMTEEDKLRSMAQVISYVSTKSSEEYLEALFEPVWMSAKNRNMAGNAHADDNGPSITEEMHNEKVLQNSWSRIKGDRNVFDAFNSSASDRGCRFGGLRDDCCSEHSDDHYSPVKMQPCHTKISLPSDSSTCVEPASHNPELYHARLPSGLSKEADPVRFTIGKSNETDEVIDVEQSSPSKSSHVMKMVTLSCSEMSQEDESGDDWQRVFDDQYNPEMPIEHSYNLSEAHVWPRCAVCSMFRVFYKESANKLSEKHEKIKSKYERDGFDASKPLLTESVFALTKLKMANYSPVKRTPSEIKALSKYSEIQIDSRKPSPILKCKNCCLSVHATCYGVHIDLFSTDNWFCDPCALVKQVDVIRTEAVTSNYNILKQWPQQFSATCLLCPNKGGALKRVSKLPLWLMHDAEADDFRKRQPGGVTWVHVNCAVSLPEVFFSDLQHSSVDLSNVERHHISMKCSVCFISARRSSCSSETSELDSTADQLNSSPRPLMSACLQCFNEFCNRAVHLTCAYNSLRWTITPSCHPYTVKVYCKQHAQCSSAELLVTERRSGVKYVVPIGDRASSNGDSLWRNCKVFAKINKRYREGTFLGRSTIDFYRVLFDDGLESKDLTTDNFFGHDWAVRGEPYLNQRVNILWNDGQLYPAKFIGTITANYCEILFADTGQVIQVEEKDVVAM